MCLNLQNDSAVFVINNARNYFSRKGAKAQRKPLETRQRFAPLREKFLKKETTDCSTRDNHRTVRPFSSYTKGKVQMKIVLSLCCMTLAMLIYPGVSNNQSGSAFRTINIHQKVSGANYFESMAITSSEDFKAFLEEITQDPRWTHPEVFVDALLEAQIDFNEEALVLLRHDEGAGSVRVSFETPVLQGRTLLCEIRGELHGIGTANMAYHCFALAVSKSLVDTVQLNAVGGVPEGR